MTDAPLWFTRATLRVNAPDVMPLVNTLVFDGDEGHRLERTHRLLWTLMPEAMQRAGKPVGDRAAFLWRAAPEPDVAGRYYLLGPKPRADSAFFDIETTAWEPVFTTGDRLFFDIFVNATINRLVRPAKGRDGRQRVDVVMDAIRAAERRSGQPSRAALRNAVMDQALGDWWTAQGEKHGFRVRGRIEVGDYRTLPLTDRLKGGGKPPQLGVAHLAGVIEVVDPIVFSARVGRGFGRAKAFGCGLLLLKRER